MVLEKTLWSAKTRISASGCEGVFVMQPAKHRFGTNLHRILRDDAAKADSEGRWY
jgi:hypothetical protein